MLPSLRIVVAVPFLALVACSSAHTLDSSADAGDGTYSRDAGNVSDAGAYDAGSDAGACDPSIPIALIVDKSLSGAPQNINVPITFGGQHGLFLFDTGNEQTFASTPAGSPDPITDDGTLTLGSCSFEVMGRPFAFTGEDGLPALGNLGTDTLFQTKRTLLDLAGDTFARLSDDGLSTSGWLPTKIEFIQGSMIADVTLSGTPVRLLLDTGSPDILWIGQQGQPGDVEYQDVDAEGNLITVYQGTVSAEISPGVTETLPVERAPTFPYLQDRINTEFGGNVQGLLGLSALGARRIVFDYGASTVYREPTK